MVGGGLTRNRIWSKLKVDDGSVVSYFLSLNGPNLKNRHFVTCFLRRSGNGPHTINSTRHSANRPTVAYSRHWPPWSRVPSNVEQVKKVAYLFRSAEKVRLVARVRFSPTTVSDSRAKTAFRELRRVSVVTTETRDSFEAPYEEVAVGWRTRWNRMRNPKTPTVEGNGVATGLGWVISKMYLGPIYSFK